MENEKQFERGRTVLHSAAMRAGKKLTVFLLAFGMMMSNLPCGALQNVYAGDEILTENVEIDGVLYKEIEPGKMQIVQWAEEELVNFAEIVIPGTVTYDGREYTVTSIGNSVFAYKKLNKVTLPDTIESIGQEAFRDCGTQYMQEITLPGSLKEIGKYAFWNSTIKGELVIPDSVTWIGQEAFRATQISGLVISNPNTVYESQVFSWNLNLTSVTLPDGMTSLGGASFLWSCKKLERIDLPESITSIPKSALSGCESLKEIHIPDSVTEIGNSAFYGCSSLTEIVIPEGVKEIPSWGFYKCGDGLCITLPDSIISVHSRAFWDKASEKETYSKSITVKCTSKEVAALVAGIGHQNILLNNEPYELLTFDEGGYTFTVTDSENNYIQLDKWAGTRPVGEVTIPEKVTWNGKEYTVKAIGENAFSACTGITKVTLPDTITAIGAYAFYNCTALVSIRLPKDITRIEQMTFNNCRSLTDLTLPSKLQFLGPFAFGDCKGLQSIEIPGSCVRIDSGAFYQCSGITEVTLHEGMTEVGNNMFCGCTGIREISLPNSVQKINDVAFQSCTNLEKVTLSQNLTEVGAMIFKGCDKLTGTIVLPDSVTTIRENAFADSSLTGVHVGSGLTILGSGAFPDTIRLTTNDLDVWKILSRNTNRENAPVFLWDGTCDIPGGIHAYVEEELVITDRAEIGAGAIVTILPEASLTVNGTLVNNGTVEGTGAFTVDGIITGTGSLGAGMLMTFLLAEAMIADVENAVYTASSITPQPEISVTSGNSKIIFEKDVDFTYSYANNTNPGTADITVTPKAGGKLKGDAVTKHFTIEKAARTDSLECSLSFLENEDMQTFSAVIERVEGAEYSFDGKTWTDENRKTDCQPRTEYTAYIRWKETAAYLAGEAVQKTETAPRMTYLLTEAMVSDIENAVYTASPIAPCPEVSIMAGGNKIIFEKDVDFTYSYGNNTNPGMANITVTPKAGGQLRGNAVTKHFIIEKAVRTDSLECRLTFLENKDGKTFSAVIEKVEGAEYSFDGEAWTDENRKTDCLPKTEYTAYIRWKETDTHLAGNAAEKTGISPELKAVTGNKLAAPEISQLKSAADSKGVYVLVTVKAVAGADRYEIYRKAGTETKLILTTKPGSVEIRDENPIQSAVYYAVAIAKDGGAKSAAGQGKSIRLSKGTKIKKVSPSSAGIKITWKKAKNAKKYVLYRSTKKKSGYVRVKVLGKKKLSYLDKKAKKGKKYYYKIVVLEASGASLMSGASKGVKRR